MSCKRPPHRSSAPAKIILLGEHAVVYGQPAIAAPVPSLRAYASAQPSHNALNARSIELNQRASLHRPASAAAARPLRQLLQLAAGYFGLSDARGDLVIQSDIPVGGGMGSGAAVSAAAMRALAALYGRQIPDEALNQLVFEMEKLHHGRPSGIDNSVVVYERPIYFEHGKDLAPLTVKNACHILIADTGHAAKTSAAVARVRQGFTKNQAAAEAIFARIGKLVRSARQALEGGQQRQLGALMNENQRLLRQLGISSPALDTLVEASMAAGALGAKLSGGGMGGNMIALLEQESSCQAVSQALTGAGAARIVHCVIDR